MGALKGVEDFSSWFRATARGAISTWTAMVLHGPGRHQSPLDCSVSLAMALSQCVRFESSRFAGLKGLKGFAGFGVSSFGFGAKAEGIAFG